MIAGEVSDGAAAAVGLRLVRGDPTAEELAALVAALTCVIRRGKAQREESSSQVRRAAWIRPGTYLAPGSYRVRGCR